MKYRAVFRFDLPIDIEATSEEEAFDNAVNILSNMTEDDLIRACTNNRKVKLSDCFDDPKISEYRSAKHAATNKPSWYEYLKRHWKR